MEGPARDGALEGLHLIFDVEPTVPKSGPAGGVEGGAAFVLDVMVVEADGRAIENGLLEPGFDAGQAAGRLRLGVKVERVVWRGWVHAAALSSARLGGARLPLLFDFFERLVPGFRDEAPGEQRLDQGEQEVGQTDDEGGEEGGVHLPAG